MGLGTIFKNIGEKTRTLLSGFSSLSSKIKGKVPKNKIKINPKIMLIVSGALGIIIVLLLILAIVSRRKPGSQDTGQQSAYSDTPIQREKLPSEDFFLPYEPDFVPDVLLEKEPKDSWTDEDARPFWTNPLDGNEAAWRRRIETGIDSLLENVP